MPNSNSILQSYFVKTVNKKTGTKLSVAELLEHNRQMHGGDFLTPLSFYLNILSNVDKAMFVYMDAKQKAQLEHELQMAYLLLLAEKQYELEHQKNENVKIYNAQIKYCGEILDKLNPELQKIVERDPAQENFTDGKPIKYLGIPLAQEFAAKLMEWSDRKTKTIKEYMGTLNEKRLYWVWGSVFLKTVLSLVPADFFNSQQANNAIYKPDPYTGCLSWSLYYFRFSLNLFLLLKHTIKGPWMSEVESQTPWYDRFETQWAQRKFTLLNDSLWGTANLVCFFWLNGKTALGPWGDALTIVLLVFDISVALWDYAEQQTQHKAKMLQIENDIKMLQKQKDTLKTLIDDENERKKKQQQLDRQIASLNKEAISHIRAWKMQTLSLYTNIAYAIGLMISFVMLTMPFVPIPAATAMALGITGAVLCFALTVICSAVKGGIEIYKAQAALNDTEKEFQAKVGSLMTQMFKGDVALDENQKRFLFLEIKKLDAQTAYQKQAVALQTAHLFRSIIIESFVPAAIFSSLVFLPLGIGLAALAAGFALAVLSNSLIDVLFKPQAVKELPETFNEQEYDDFCDLIMREPSLRQQHAFFKNHKPVVIEQDNPELDGELSLS